MNNTEQQKIFKLAKQLRKSGLLPTLTQEDIDNEPTALAFSYPNESSLPDVLYRVFLQGYKMGLLGVDEIQSDAEFRAFKHKLGLEDEDN